MKKLFENIFKSESKLNYEPSTTADGYASDLKLICSRYDRFNPIECEECENHPGFHHCYNGSYAGCYENIRDPKEITEILTDMIIIACSNMIGGNVNEKARTIDRTINMKSTENAIRNIIPHLSDQDLLSCNKMEDIVMFFVGTYKETPGITSGVAIVSFKLRLDIKNYFVSIDISEAIGYTYTDFRWISNHLARI